MFHLEFGRKISSRKRRNIQNYFAALKKLNSNLNYMYLQRKKQSDFLAVWLVELNHQKRDPVSQLNEMIILQLHQFNLLEHFRNYGCYQGTTLPERRSIIQRMQL